MYKLTNTCNCTLGQEMLVRTCLFLCVGPYKDATETNVCKVMQDHLTIISGANNASRCWPPSNYYRCKCLHTETFSWGFEGALSYNSISRMQSLVMEKEVVEVVLCNGIKRTCVSLLVTYCNGSWCCTQCHSESGFLRSFLVSTSQGNEKKIAESKADYAVFHRWLCWST